MLGDYMINVPYPPDLKQYQSCTLETRYSLKVPGFMEDQLDSFFRDPCSLYPYWRQVDCSDYHIHFRQNLADELLGPLKPAFLTTLQGLKMVGTALGEFPAAHDNVLRRSIGDAQVAQTIIFSRSMCHEMYVRLGAG